LAIITIAKIPRPNWSHRLRTKSSSTPSVERRNFMLPEQYAIAYSEPSMVSY